MGLAVVEARGASGGIAATEFRQFSDSLSADEKVRLSHMNRPTLLAAIAAIQSDGHEALEIGCWKGETTAWLLGQRVKGVLFNVTVIDTFEWSPELGPQSHDEVYNAFCENTAAVGRYYHVNVLRGRSVDRLPEVRKNSFDFIYVDGSHDSRDVIVDAALAFDRLAVGGVMVFGDFLWNYHDDQFRNPGPAISFFLQAWKESITVLQSAYQVTVRKERG